MSFKVPTPHSAVRTLDVLLESSSEPSPHDAAPSNGARHRSISLLRCVVLAQHLDLVLGAIERAIPSKLLGRLKFPLFEGELEVNGHATVVFRIEAIAKIRRLRTQVLNAILPAVVAVDSSPSVSDFLSPTIGPIAINDVGGRHVGRSLVTIRKVGIYTVDGPNERDKKPLRFWTAPMPGRRPSSKRKAS